MKRTRLKILLTIAPCLLTTISAINLSRSARAQQPQHTEIKIDAKLFDQYAGQYSFVDDPEFMLNFWREGEKFFMQPTNQGRIEIFAESETRFFLKIIEAQATFVRDSQGKVTGLVWRQNGVDNQAKKVSDKPVIETLVPFERREEMIKMRDGVRLHTFIFTPPSNKPLPIMMSRTPYGIGQANSDGINRRYNDLVKDGYIFVLQDIRGRYGSEGQFMMNRPLHDKNDPKGVDESTDTYDTIDWLIKNVGNNDNVGILGVSYDGWLAAVATVDAHPALKASSPQAPMTDTWLGDDFFHNGAFRQSYGYEYVKGMETSKEGTDVSFDKDAYDWYLGMGSLGKITELNAGKFPTWNAFVSHPSYDDYWKGRGRNLGAVTFGTSTGAHFRAQIQAPWFAYYLKDKGKLNEPEAMTFETGANQWTAYDHWSPKESTPRDLFLRVGKKLAFEKPSGNDSETYSSDPAAPVPYRKRPIEATYDRKGSGWYTWLVSDQRFLKDRNDVVTWQSEVLDKDLVVAGDIVAHLFAATTGTDSDWVVKLIDVYPDDPGEKNMAGYQLMVADEIFRGRYLKSFEKATPIVASQVNEYSIDLHSANHCFKKGHRVMVQVQSTWFPLYDRNPQKFVENIFNARSEDYQMTTQRVYESARYPSHVTLPIMK